MQIQKLIENLIVLKEKIKNKLISQKSLDDILSSLYILINDKLNN